ncbi:MAG: DUF5667 domain-containing protein [Candidatus Paceibacterota bacterium]
MKKLLLSVISLVLLLGLVTPTAAQFGWLPKAGVTPDSPFYFLDQWGEGISMAFTFSNEAKAKKALRFSEERLAEMKTMSEKGKTKQAEKAAEKYQQALNSVQKRSEQTKEDQKRGKVTAQVASSTSKHLSVLEETLGKVPEEARSALKKAKESSKQGHMQALESLSKTNPDEAAKIGAKSLQQRLEEIEQVTVTNATTAKQLQRVESITKDFQDLSKGFKEMTQNSNRIEVQEIVGSSTSQHIETLRGVYEKVPQAAKESIQKAIDVSEQGRERAMEALRNASEKGQKGAGEALDRVEGLTPPGGAPSQGDSTTSGPTPDQPDSQPGPQQQSEQSGQSESQETPGLEPSGEQTDQDTDEQPSETPGGGPGM